jgi:Transposase DDE domain
LIVKNKHKLLEFRINNAYFTRNRVLTLEHTVGLLLSMTASRNENGYDISSQNYFRELGSLLEKDIDPARRQSVSIARSKLKWQAFEHLLHDANLEASELPDKLKFKGHITRAIDGTSFYTPLSTDLLGHFSRRKTKSEEGETHYPYGLCVSAINIFTGQPVRAIVDDYKESERSLMKAMIGGFKAGDLALLDRGLGGAQVYLEFIKSKQFFIHRTKTGGDRVAGYVRKFLHSDKFQKRVKLKVMDEETGIESKIQLRLVRGPDESDGKPIVFVTNLTGKNRYSRDEIVSLYQKRWDVETMYGRVKNLLRLEKFHAKSYNGVMQELFANLLILSLTAVAVTAVVEKNKIDLSTCLPSFKSAAETIRRHLYSVIDCRITETKPKKLIKQIMIEVEAIIYKIRPGRSYARVSKQPIQSWNLKKSAKIRAFEEQRKQAIPADKRDGGALST